MRINFINDVLKSLNDKDFKASFVFLLFYRWKLGD